LARPSRKHHFRRGCRGNVFTEPFTRSGRLFLLKNLVPSNGRRSVVCFAAVAQKRVLLQSRSLVMAVSLAPQFLLGTN
jgi:hypothetical protein